MKPPTLHQSGFVCRSCREARRSPSLTLQLSSRPSLSTNTNLSPSQFTTPRRGRTTHSLSLRMRNVLSPYIKRQLSVATNSKSTNPSRALALLIANSERIRLSTTIPDEADVLEVLESSEKLAAVLTNGQVPESVGHRAQTKPTDTPTSAILGLDEPVGQVTRKLVQRGEPLDQRSAALAKSLRDLLVDPKVYISPPMLTAYVNIQVILGKPDYIPEIFYLYACKPIARPQNPPPLPPPSSSPSSSSTELSKLDSNHQPRIFKPTSPRNPKNAIPLHLATSALNSTIHLRSLPLALSVIESSVATPAFRLNKVLRRATLPLTFLSITPFCAYTIATYIGHEYQTTYDAMTATYFTMAGIMAYVGTTATLGFAALTTHNDHMRRVVWQPGTPLRDRWLREEERAAFDRLALAWGFREKWRWGEERGEDWEALREFCARRGMILDKTNLLDGMQ